MTIKEAVQAILHAHGKTSADLARAMGKSPQSLNGIFKKNSAKKATFDAIIAGLIKLDIKPEGLSYRQRAIEFIPSNQELEQESTQMAPSDLEAMVITTFRSAPDKVKACRAIMEEVLRQKEESYQQRRAGHKVA